MTHIFTITARNYLSLALTLGDSVARLHPEATFTICVADGIEDIDELLPKSLHPRHFVVSALGLLPAAEIKALAFKYNITEFCTAIKPLMFKSLFEEDPGAKVVFYMDPDTYLYSRLDPIVSDSSFKTLYLSPHLIDCRIEDDQPYKEYHHLWEGIFNLGFCAIRKTEKSDFILDWWSERLKEYCYADYLDGLHTDQKWMDYAPVFFPNDLQIVKNYGVNVAHWNLYEREVARDGAVLRAGSDELIFFHFSGFDFINSNLTKHVSSETQRKYLNEVVCELASDYRSKVLANKYHQFLSVPYLFSHFDNGVPVTAPLRRMFRVWSKENVVVDPFSTSETFYKLVHINGLADISAAARGNYSKGTVKNISGKIEIIQRTLRIVLKFFGFKRYSQFVKLSAWLGRYENHSFLIETKK